MTDHNAGNDEDVVVAATARERNGVDPGKIITIDTLSIHLMAVLLRSLSGCQRV